MNDNENETADRALRTRDAYLTELDQVSYWELMEVLVAEGDYLVCGRPADEGQHQDHTDETGGEWIAPLVVLEVVQHTRIHDDAEVCDDEDCLRDHSTVHEDGEVCDGACDA